MHVDNGAGASRSRRRDPHGRRPWGSPSRVGGEPLHHRFLHGSWRARYSAARRQGSPEWQNEIVHPPSLMRDRASHRRLTASSTPAHPTSGAQLERGGGSTCHVPPNTFARRPAPSPAAWIRTSSLLL